MTKALFAFQAVPGLGGIYTAEKGNLRCTAVRLADGGICLYSPVLGLGDAARASLMEIGSVTHLLAPNHYHHKGVAEFAGAFPKATLCTTEAARPRLEKQTGLDFKPLTDARIDLPDGATWIEPKGLKTGEVWIDIAFQEERLWVVTDAFCGPKAHKMSFADEPELLGTFRTYGIGDLAVYREWLTPMLRFDAPTTVIPCHGAMIRSRSFGRDAIKLVADLT